MMVSMKRLLVTLAVILTLFAALLLALPALLSTDLVRARILSAANRSMDGTLSAEAWRVTWRDGITIRAPRLDMPARGATVRAASIVVDRGLLALLRQPGAFGTVIIENPDVRLTVPAAPRPSGKTPPPDTPSRQDPAPPQAASRPPALPVDLKGAIEIRRGALTVAQGAQPPLTLSDISCRIVLSGLSAPIAFDLSAAPPAARVSGETSRAALRGTLTLPPPERWDPMHTALDATLSVTNLDLAVLSGVARAFTDAPAATGRLSAEAAVSRAPGTALDVDARFRVSDLRLAGGPLGPDTPRIERFDAHVAVQADAAGWRVRAFRIESPLIESTGSGSLVPANGAAPRGSLALNAAVDLARLAREFPATLRIRDGLRVNAGRLTLGLVLDATDEGLTVVGSLKLPALDAVLDGRPVALDDPLVFHLRGAWRDGTPVIDEARFTASFGSVVCSGTPAALRMTLDTRLEALLSEAGKFVTLGAIDAAGTVKIDATLSVPIPPADPAFGVSAAGAVYLTDVVFSTPALKGDRPRIPYCNATCSAVVSNGSVHVRDLALDSAFGSARAARIAVSRGAPGALPAIAFDLEAELQPLALAAELPTTLPDLAPFGLETVRLDLRGALGPCPDGASADWATVLRTVEAEGRIEPNRLVLLGVELDAPSAEVTAADGVATGTLATRFSDGLVRIRPVIDTRAAPPVLTLAETGTVVSNVAVTDAMMSEMFGRIHPVLKHCVVSSGRASLRLDALQAPLDPEARDRIMVRGALETHDLVVAPAGLLSEILNVTELNPGRVGIPDQTIDFTCADGRITPSPLEIHSGEYHMILRGSVGLDGTLDYVADIPATRELVGEKAWPFLRDTRLQLRISGTADRPVVDRNAIRSAVAGLVRDALKNVIMNEGGKLLEGLLKGR
jgi:hypothetical protein